MDGMNRACVIVLDSAGIGELPDAAAYGDKGSHTLGNIHKAVGGLRLPNLYALGLGNIENSGLPSVTRPKAAYGRMAEVTRAKDTTSGHWELAGLVTEPPFATFPNGLPESFLTKWTAKCGLPGWIGNVPASGTEIIIKCGE
ncbi:MAG: phosphopentomutase, partial [Defluviitaleaceae bacterium]|nr:phosphopentomutase [Defluviitaleaceae bacterium]